MVKSSLPYLFAGIVVGLLVLSLPDYANAQGPYRPGRYQPRPSRYQSPSGPALSPYLNYFRRDVGVTDQYNAFVNPIQNQQRFNSRQTQSVSGLRNQVQGIENGRNVAPSRLSPTGKGATFMNYSHFYRMGR
ncbi:MAG: hypothetical protein COA78_35680 [Blastopirellula sp.]|nr:MAG: hypothetical protein COA78_35680 [Blastopirellula sp.]